MCVCVCDRFLARSTLLLCCPCHPTMLGILMSTSGPVRTPGAPPPLSIPPPPPTAIGLRWHPWSSSGRRIESRQGAVEGKDGCCFWMLMSVKSCRHLFHISYLRSRLALGCGPIITSTDLCLWLWQWDGWPPHQSTVIDYIFIRAM